MRTTNRGVGRVSGKRSSPRGPLRHSAFTLVELLVVITIIGILAGLITVAVVAGLEKAHEAQIKVEIDQISTAFQQYKNKYGSYPPNFVTSGHVGLNQQQVARHLKKAFPRIGAPDLAAATAILQLQPPLNPAEAVVFWLSGFSADPARPLTGRGGPLWDPATAQPPQPIELNLDERDFNLYSFNRSRIVQSTDTSGNPRTVTLGGTPIPLYIYQPPKLVQPYVYFDTSRYNPVAPSGAKKVSWPLYDAGNQTICAYRRKANEFVNSKSYQVLSAGRDDEWGDSLQTDSPTTLYNQGPFVDGHADNLVSFSERTLEDSQP